LGEWSAELPILADPTGRHSSPGSSELIASFQARLDVCTAGLYAHTMGVYGEFL